MIRCAVYARYSSDLQRPESIADQIRHCRQEAARHPDWAVLDDQLYADEAVSGVSVEGRIALKRLVEAARQKPRPFDLVLVDDTSRLARDVVDAVRLLRDCDFTGFTYTSSTRGSILSETTLTFSLPSTAPRILSTSESWARKRTVGSKGRYSRA